MEHIEIKCNRCNQKIEHRCNTELITYIKELLSWQVRSAPPRGFKSSRHYVKGDENTPFFSEAYLYNLLGKEDARTILAMIDNIIIAAGYDPISIDREED